MPRLLELMTSGSIPSIGNSSNAPSVIQHGGKVRKIKHKPFKSLNVPQQQGMRVPNKRMVKAVTESEGSIEDLQFYFDLSVAGGMQFDDALTKTRDYFQMDSIQADKLGRVSLEKNP